MTRDVRLDRIFRFSQVPGGFILAGELDNIEAAPFASAVSHLLERGTTGDVVIDVTDLMFCDDSGLRIIVGLALRLPTGQRVILEGVRPQLRRLLEVTGFDALVVERPKITIDLTDAERAVSPDFG